MQASTAGRRTFAARKPGRARRLAALEDQVEDLRAKAAGLWHLTGLLFDLQGAPFPSPRPQRGPRHLWSVGDGLVAATLAGGDAG